VGKRELELKCEREREDSTHQFALWPIAVGLLARGNGGGALGLLDIQRRLVAAQLPHRIICVLRVQRVRGYCAPVRGRVLGAVHRRPRVALALWPWYHDHLRVREREGNKGERKTREAMLEELEKSVREPEEGDCGTRTWPSWPEKAV
jgi:hypothetical protein